MTEILANIRTVIVGKDQLLEQIMIAVLCGGHVLLEGLPGTGKTKLALALAKSVKGDFKRIQFTPDVLPSDITGFYYWDQHTDQMIYRAGAVMCHFLLADEINRASPRVQSSLLEAMEERQITIDGRHIALPHPFIVIATENAMDSYGTYPLPEAQIDRFFMKLETNYPTRAEWIDILERFEKEDSLKDLVEVTNIETLISLQEAVKEVVVSQSIRDYVVDFIEAIMMHQQVKIGVSPRGSIALIKAAKARAFMMDRTYVTPDDVQVVAESVLNHRIILKASSSWNQLTTKDLIRELIGKVEPPIC